MTGKPRADCSRNPRAIAFELSWQAIISGCSKYPIYASFVSGHDFSRAAKPKRSRALARAAFRAACGLVFDHFRASQAAFLPNPHANSFKCDCPGGRGACSSVPRSRLGRLRFPSHPTATPAGSPRRFTAPAASRPIPPIQLPALVPSLTESRRNHAQR